MKVLRRYRVALLLKRIEYNRMSKCNLHKIRHKMLN